MGQPADPGSVPLDWTSLGAALAGSDGEPQLLGKGPLVSSGTVTFVLAHARPLAPVYLVAGLSAINVPFKGGFLVPSPDVLVFGLFTDGFGALELPAALPPGLPVGEVTLGEYLKGHGLHLALAGKTHVLPDLEGLERYGIEGGSAIATLDYRRTDPRVVRIDFVEVSPRRRGEGLGQRLVAAAVDWARREAGTVVLDFRVEQEDSVYPMVPSGADLGDMIRRPHAAPSPLVETGADTEEDEVPR